MKKRAIILLMILFATFTAVSAKERLKTREKSKNSIIQKNLKTENNLTDIGKKIETAEILMNEDIKKNYLEILEIYKTILKENPNRIENYLDLANFYYKYIETKTRTEMTLKLESEKYYSEADKNLKIYTEYCDNNNKEYYLNDIMLLRKYRKELINKSINEIGIYMVEGKIYQNRFGKYKFNSDKLRAIYYYRVYIDKLKQNNIPIELPKSIIEFMIGELKYDSIEIKDEKIKLEKIKPGNVIVFNDESTTRVSQWKNDYKKVDGFYIRQNYFTTKEMRLFFIETGKINQKLYEEENREITTEKYIAVEFCNWMSLKEKLPKAYNDIGELIDENGVETKEINKIKGYRLPTKEEVGHSIRELSNVYEDFLWYSSSDVWITGENRKSNKIGAIGNEENSKYTQYKKITVVKNSFEHRNINLFEIGNIFMFIYIVGGIYLIKRYIENLKIKDESETDIKLFNTNKIMPPAYLVILILTAIMFVMKAIKIYYYQARVIFSTIYFDGKIADIIKGAEVVILLLIIILFLFRKSIVREISLFYFGTVAYSWTINLITFYIDKKKTEDLSVLLNNGVYHEYINVMYGFYAAVYMILFVLVYSIIMNDREFLKK